MLAPVGSAVGSPSDAPPVFSKTSLFLSNISGTTSTFSSEFPSAGMPSAGIPSAAPAFPPTGAGNSPAGTASATSLSCTSTFDSPSRFEIRTSCTSFLSISSPNITLPTTTDEISDLGAIAGNKALPVAGNKSLPVETGGTDSFVS